MASFCPACYKKLKPYHIKAECPCCGANIPNHNWEDRLEQDAYEREKAYFKMHTSLNMLKFSAIGTPLRIIRLACSFLPIIGYIVPLATLVLEGKNGTLITAKPVNLLSFFTNDSFKFKNIFALLTDGTNKIADDKALIAFILLAASLLFGVIAFFLIPIIFKKPKQPVTAVFHLLSTVTYALSPVMFTKFIETFNEAGLGNCEGNIMWGIVVGIALFVIALILDIAVLAVKVDEKEYKYVPTDDILQREYAIAAGKITKDEQPYKKNK